MYSATKTASVSRSGEKIFYQNEKKLLTCAPLGGGILGQKFKLVNEGPRATMSKITTKSLRGLVWIALAASSTLLGQPPFKPVSATDTRFLPISGGSGDYCYHESSAPVSYQLEITRAVGVSAGPFGPDIVDSQGYLTNPSAAIANGIVGAKAKLEIQVYDTDYCYVPYAICPPGVHWPWQSFSDPVYVNGREVGNLKSEMNQISQQSFSVPVEYLKFGRLNPEGGPPIKGVNTIEIRPNQRTITRGEDGSLLVGPEIRQCTLGPLSLQIEALAPILFVHGFNSGREWFEEAPPGATWPAFAYAFRSRNIPFKTVGSLGEGHIDEIGTGKLKDEVVKASVEFGVKHFHLVAHSKGGLWSRSFMTKGIPGGLSVFSLTTLDTPHHGSVAADIRDGVHRVSWLGTAWTPLMVMALFGTWTRSLEDLTVKELARYNDKNRLHKFYTVDGERNDVDYMSHSGDANVNDNEDADRFGIIDCPAECFGYRTIVAKQMYRIMQRYKSAALDKDAYLLWYLDYVEYKFPPYPKNDFAVTVDSAQHPGFRHVTFWKKNHTTIGDGEVSDAVRSTNWLELERWLKMRWGAQ